MDSRNPINYQQMATGIRHQMANQELGCPLLPKKLCRSARWCHVKVVIGRENLRKRLSSKAISARLSPVSMPQTNKADEANRLNGYGAFVGMATLLRNRKSEAQIQAAIDSNLRVQTFLARLLGVSRLQVLETEEALWRGRCWLLRTCLVPFLYSFGKLKQYLTSDKVQR